jgi:hypothetical protein
MDPAAPPMLTVALDTPSARVLADQAAVVGDLQFVMDCCKRLLAELGRPDRDRVLSLALWSSAVTAYGRCFGRRKRAGLTADDVRALPLGGAVTEFHRWVLAERDKLTARSAEPSDAARVGAALARDGRRRVEGVVILSTSRVLITDIGVRQLGGLASELAKQVAERAQRQQDTVLEDAQRLDVDSLYQMTPLQVGPQEEAGEPGGRPPS